MIEGRLSTNVWTTPEEEGLNGLFALVNHSCEPNLEWEVVREDFGQEGTDEGGEEGSGDGGGERGVVILTTTRDVHKGEQLLVEYDRFVHEEKVGVRRNRLRRWLVGDCECGRCVREAKEEKERGRDRQRALRREEGGGEGGDEDGGEVEGGWDIPEKERPLLLMDTVWGGW